MSQNRPPETYASPRCAAGCGKIWEKWCRGCNLVYCASDVDPTKHKCKPPEVRPYPPVGAVKPEAEPTPSLGVSTPTLAPPAQTELFGAPPPNGVASHDIPY